MNSQETVATSFGYQDICEKRNEKNQQKNNIMVSVVQPQDHANPQFVVKLNREILETMNWEISDRIRILSSMDKKRIALIKTESEYNNAFKITSQGSDVENAIYKRRGGALKVGWRQNLCKPIQQKGTFATKYKVIDGALYVELPSEMFE